jgi:thioredoxin 1
MLAVSEKTFTQEVLESSNLVLVNFWAPWCGLCRLTPQILIKLQAEWGDRIKVVSINADENLKLASKYKLTTLPTLILFEQEKVCHRIDRFHGRDDLQKALEQVLVSSIYSA